MSQIFLKSLSSSGSLSGPSETHTHVAVDITDFDVEVENNSEVTLNTAHRNLTHAPTNAEANVNADWNSLSGDSEILNKPVIISDHGSLGNLLNDDHTQYHNDIRAENWLTGSTHGAIKLNGDIYLNQDSSSVSSNIYAHDGARLWYEGEQWNMNGPMNVGGDYLAIDGPTLAINTNGLNSEDVTAHFGHDGNYDADHLKYSFTSGGFEFSTKLLVNGVLSAASIENVLELDNTISFTPTTDFHPATKKYVDDTSPKVKSKIGISLDGGGGEITLGAAGDTHMMDSFTILSATMLAEPLTGTTGSISIDIYSTLYATYPPDDGDTICDTNPPTIAADIKSQDTVLLDWTTAIPANSVFRFDVLSCTNIKKCTLVLEIEL